MTDPDSDPRPGAAQRVLIVDDNVDAAESLAELLSLTGVVAGVAHDGPSALALVRESAQPFDVALLDIGLPGMDGWTLGAQLRREHGAAMRIVALTGYGESSDRERARASGFDELLVKPVDPERLLRMLGA